MSSIFLIGHEAAMAVMVPIRERLLALGHDVHLHESPASLRALPDWAGAELLIIAAIGCTRADIEAAPALRGIVTATIGFDCVDVAAASDHGILVANGQVPENHQSMAEAMFMLMIAGLYDLHASERSFWPAKEGPPPDRRMVAGKTIGLVGYGNIARALIQRLVGWEADVQAFSRFPEDRPDVRFVPLEELLRTSDVLIVTANLTEATRHLLNRERLALVKPGALLVNAARGAIIDEAALIDTLRSGRIRKAMLDVFEIEPLPLGSPLRTLPNVVLTPHNAGHTREIVAAIPDRAIRNGLDILNGRVPASCQNLTGVPAWEARARA